MNKIENKDNMIKSVIDALPDRLFELIKDKKEETGLTQEKQADEMGISKGSLTKYVSGKAIPNADTIFTMAKYYDCSADYLLGLSNIPIANINDAEMSKQLGLSEIAIQTLKKWKKYITTGESITFIINYLFELDYMKYFLLSMHRVIYGDVKEFNLLTKQNKDYSCRDIYLVENQENKNENEILMECENYTDILDKEYINKVHELQLYDRIKKIKEIIISKIDKFPNKLKNFNIQGLK